MSVHATPDPDDTAPASPDGFDDDAEFDFATDRDNDRWLMETYADHQHPPDGRPQTLRTEDLPIARDLPIPMFKLESSPNGQRQLQRHPGYHRVPVVIVDRHEHAD